MIFKNTANVSLRGSTFDARHMDSFLSSGFGEKSIMAGDGDYNGHVGGSVSERKVGLGGGGRAFLSTMNPSYLL